MLNINKSRNSVVSILLPNTAGSGRSSVGCGWLPLGIKRTGLKWVGGLLVVIILCEFKICASIVLQFLTKRKINISMPAACWGEQSSGWWFERLSKTGHLDPLCCLWWGRQSGFQGACEAQSDWLPAFFFPTFLLAPKLSLLLFLSC